MAFNRDFVKDHPTRSKLLDCACNLPTVCGRHSGCNILARFPDPLASKKVGRGTWLPTYLQFAGGTVGALVGWAPAPGQELAQSP